jgi:transposase
MTKFDDAFKRKVVQEYFSGASGTEALGRKYGVGRTTLRRWISGWERHGQDGLNKKHTAYSAEFKLHVLEHRQRHGLSYSQTGVMFDLREAGAIARWERQYHEGGFEALKPRRKGRPPNMPTPKQPPQPASEPTQDERSREDLLKENEYLRAEVAYLKKLDALLRAKEQASPKKKPKR